MTTMDITSHNPYFNHAITEKKAKYQNQCDVDDANIVGASFSDTLCDLFRRRQTQSLPLSQMI